MIEDSSNHISDVGNAKKPGASEDAASHEAGAPTFSQTADSRQTDPGGKSPDPGSSAAAVPGDPRGKPDAGKTVISQRPPASLPVFKRASTPYEMGRTLEGERLGHFQLEEFVGGGGMGAVFRATDVTLGRTVAVKVVSRNQTDEETLRRFSNEATSAARLDHPNIARVYYVGEDKGWYYIVFEYIEGINVRDLVASRGPLPIEDALSYTLQIAEALEHASHRDVIHRDIKPSNILIMVDGHAKLVDMGLARLHQVESSADELTASGVTLGTFDYISPEQADDPRNTDVRSDLYSLGCTLYYMLTGQAPFPEGTMLQKLLKHSSTPAPNPRELRPDLPDAVAGIVNKLLAKLPADRHQTPRELISDLLVVADQLGIASLKSTRSWPAGTQPSLTPLQRHLPWALPMILLLLGVGLIELSNRFKPQATIPAPRTLTQFPVHQPGVDAKPRVDRPSASSPKTSAVTNQSSNSTDSGNSTSETAGPPDENQRSPATTSEADKPAAPAHEPADGALKRASVPSDSAPPTSSNGEASPLKGSEPVEPTNLPKEDSSSESAVDQPADNSAHPDTTPGATMAQEASSPTADTAKDPPPKSLPLIVVSPHPFELQAGQQRAATLKEAIQLVSAADKPTEIALRFDGPLTLDPLLIDMERIPGRQLTIRAADGYSPTLSFRPHAEASSMESDPVMIHVIGGQLAWNRIRFYFELPPSGDQPRASWSLFLLEDTDNLEFRHSALTIRNLASDGSPICDNVSFIRFPNRDVTSLWETDSTPNGVNSPVVWFDQCVARGQATLVRSERALPFLLSWNGGIFITTKRIVETGGTLADPQWGYGRVTLFFRHLLAITEQGICLMKTEDAAPYTLGLAADSYDCLFVTGRPNGSVPLYALRTTQRLTNDVIPLDIGGNNNYYKNTKVVLRITRGDSSGETEQYTFDDLKTSSGNGWFNERNPQPGTIFSWARRDKSVDQTTVHDVIPANEIQGPIPWVLSIDPTQLPTFGDSSAMRSANKPSESETEGK